MSSGVLYTFSLSHNEYYVHRSIHYEYLISITTPNPEGKLIHVYVVFTVINSVRIGNIIYPSLKYEKIFSIIDYFRIDKITNDTYALL